MGASANDIDELMQAVARVIEGLPATSIAALAKDPRAVGIALATAANVVDERLDADGRSRPRSVDRHPDYVDESEARYRLAKRTRTVAVDDTLGSDEVAQLLGLKGRASVLQRLRDHRLIGMEGERRGVRFPRGQFDLQGRVWPGTRDVRERFPDAFSAWLWLITPSTVLDGDTPLERLRAGSVDEVITAATGERQGDFV